MSDFECLPIGTAERLADLEAENASLAQLLKDIPPFEAECEECFDKRHLLEAEVERLRAHQATAIAWLVMDESDDVCHATRCRDAAHDHIKDAINNGLYCAVRWVVRPVVYAALKEGQR